LDAVWITLLFVCLKITMKKRLKSFWIVHNTWFIAWLLLRPLEVCFTNLGVLRNNPRDFIVCKSRSLVPINRSHRVVIASSAGSLFHKLRRTSQQSPQLTPHHIDRAHETGIYFQSASYSNRGMRVRWPSNSAGWTGVRRCAGNCDSEWAMSVSRRKHN
jgi:hypothetical protein